MAFRCFCLDSDLFDKIQIKPMLYGISSLRMVEEITIEVYSECGIAASDIYIPPQSPFPAVVFTDNLQANEVIIGDGDCRKKYILCYNPKETHRQQKHRSMAVEVLEKELAKHSDKKATAQWAIELLTSKRYKRYLSISKSGQIQIDQGKIRKTEKYDGKWVLETNEDTIVPLATQAD